MVVKVDIFNKALRKIQSRNTVISETERSQEAAECSKAYEGAIRETLARFDWNFARRFRTGSLLASSMVLPGWLYAYSYPADCVKMRGIAKDSVTEPQPMYEVTLKPTGSGRAIHANKSPAILIFTTFVDDPNSYDDLFIEAASWKLGSEIAGPLTKDLKRAKFCLDNFNLMLPEAKASNANEGVAKIDDADPSWISVR